MSKSTFSPEPEDGGLSKTALAADDILKGGKLGIVNDAGSVIAFMGYDEAGDGVLAVRNSEGKYRVLDGSDNSGGGLLSVLNSTDRVVAVMGADDSKADSFSRPFPSWIGNIPDCFRAQCCTS